VVVGQFNVSLNIYVVIYPADSHYSHSSIDYAFTIRVLAQVLVWSGRVHLFACLNGLEPGLNRRRRGGQWPRWWWAGLGVGLDRINPL